VFGVIGVSCERGRSDRGARLCRGQGVVKERRAIAALSSLGFRKGTDRQLCVNVLDMSRRLRLENGGAVAGMDFKGDRGTIVAQECW
jgi:hypothetical protein